MTMRVVFALAVADLRERVRRPSFLFVLLAAVALGYLAVPVDASGYAVFSLGEYRGAYDSAYVGTLVALAGGAWLAVGGFYVVKNTVTRDEHTGVGQILAATPLRGAVYLLGKYLSNLLALGAMVALLAVTALVMLVSRGESASVDLVALWLPFLLFTMPMMAVTAAAAVLFETVRPLRGGAGNVVWFVGSLIGIGQSAEAGGLLDVLGLGAVVDSLQAAIAATYPTPGDTGLALGVSEVEGVLRTYSWPGLDVTASLVAARLVIVLLATAVPVLAAIWFARFDPAATRGRAARRTRRDDVPEPVEQAHDVVAAPAFAAVTLPVTPVRRGRVMAGLFLGELRVLLKGVSYWWWGGALALFVVGLVVPPASVVNPVLPLCWVWPVLVWSRLGAQAYEHDVHLLVGYGPARRRRLLAEWTAGVVLTAVAGLSPLLRMLAAADWPGVAAWGGGLLFVPSFALLLGSLGRTARLFQGVYLWGWYAVMNGAVAVDFMGALRSSGEPAGAQPVLVAVAAVALLAICVLTQEARHARR